MCPRRCARGLDRLRPQNTRILQSGPATSRCIAPGAPLPFPSLSMPDSMSHSPTRRLFLGGTILVLGGCATSTGKRTARLPGPIWDPTGPINTPAPVATQPKLTGVLARSSWAKARPMPTRMDPMTPIQRITIHHDGMTVFTDTSRSAASGRLESIRRAHLNRRPQPFGDIGYHFAIDPAGRVWAGRPLSWQGAHVRAQNQGNIGIVMLGNYDQQRLNSSQQQTLIRFLGDQMRKYRIPTSRVATHQEMAATACPGKSLQAFMRTARNGRLS